MNTDNQPEKLAIDERKIIHILLKHLMIFKNELAYVKNLAGIISPGNSITEKEDGINTFTEGIPEKRDGINSFTEDIPEKRDGTNSLTEAIPEKKDGINSFTEAIPEKRDGTNSPTEAVPEKKDGINYFTEDIHEKRDGIKPSFTALSHLKEEAITDNILYTIFEQELLKALNEYIKTGDRQHTLYSFYENFVEAVSEKNTEAEKIKAAATILRLEDTHILPARITITLEVLEKMKVALHGYLPHTAPHDLYGTVTDELICLHNNGKATSNELREACGLSVPGFAKHLPKLQRLGLIVKQPPLNYVLTETSKHILLKTFGIAKKV